MKNTQIIVGAFLLGAGVGLAAGMLLTPEKRMQLFKLLTDNLQNLSGKLNAIKKEATEEAIQLDEHEILLGT